jgi:hypothetical protein
MTFPLPVRWDTPRTMSAMTSSLPAVVDLRWTSSGDLLLNWAEAPGARNKPVGRAEIARLQVLVDEVGFSESRREGVAILATRTRLSEALFELLDGAERALGQRIGHAEAEGRPLDVVVRALSDDPRALARHPAVGLRWELFAGKRLVEAVQRAGERLREVEEKSPSVSEHAWATLQLVSSSAAGFLVGEGEAPLSERVARDTVYKILGRRMRVLETGFVGRRRLLQRLLRVLLRGEDASQGGARKVAGACVWGMKGVGKSCAVGRVLERAKQRSPELRVAVLHGMIDERGVLEAFQEAATAGGWDETAMRLLDRTDAVVIDRVRRVMEHWRGQPLAIVLDDFEQNLERRTDGLQQVKPEAADLIEALLPVCATGKPKMLITSTASFEGPGTARGELTFVRLGGIEKGALRKLWRRGHDAKELAGVTQGTWEALAERLGRNARVLAWARALCAGKTDEELTRVAAEAAKALPVWGPGDAESEEKQAELAEMFLRHMAYEQAREAVGEAALAFVKRARVFEEVVPKEAFGALVEGLDVELDRELEVLASHGLLEVGELDGAPAYRVSPLVEPRLDVADAARWHEAASAAWEALAVKARPRRPRDRARPRPLPRPHPRSPPPRARQAARRARPRGALMSQPPYPAPLACSEPPLGAQATQWLGHSPPPPVAAHLAVCAACRLERAAFARLDEHALPPSPELRARLRKLVQRRFPACG